MRFCNAEITVRIRRNPTFSLSQTRSYLRVQSVTFAHRALAVDHLGRDDMVLLREARVDRLRGGDEALGHRVDGRVEGGGVRRGAADGALFVADEGELLELDELVDRAAHGGGIVRRAVPGPDGAPAGPNPA